MRENDDTTRPNINERYPYKDDDNDATRQKKTHRVYTPKTQKKKRRTYQTKCMYIQPGNFDRQIVEIAPKAG